MLPCDVRRAEQPVGCCDVLIAHAKTGRNQVAVIDDARIARIAADAARKASVSGKKRVFGCSFATLLSAIHDAARDNGFVAADYSTHSCRHGGAFHPYQRNMPVQDIMLRGRWRSLTTLQGYLNAANAAVLNLQMIA